MKGLWMVARRELLVRGTSKSYVIGLCASAVLVVALLIIPGLLGGGSDDYDVAVAGTDSQQLKERLPKAGENADISIKVKQASSADSARKAVTDEDVDVAIIDNKTVAATGGAVDRELSAVIDGVHQKLISERQLAEAGMDVDDVNNALEVPSLHAVQLGGDDDSGQRQGIAYVLVIVMFMLVMMPSIYVATGVVEEKSSRIVEVLLTSLKTWQLLGGKILGLGILGFFNILLPMLVGLGVGTATAALSGMPDGMVGTILSALGWWLLGYAFFAAMAGSLASLVSRQEDMNSAIGPMTMLMVATYVVSSIYVWTPTDTVARVLSFVPPFSMMMMPVRAAVNDAPLWQQLLAAVLLGLAAVGMFAIGSTIYRRSVMHTGSKLKLTEVFKKAA